MEDLKKVHEALGLEDVVPYIQSGNVVFKSVSAETERVRARLEASVEETFGFHVEVMLRTLDELDAIIQKNPFAGQPDKAPNWVVVLFLATHPADAEQALKAYSGPEEIFIDGKEAYIYYTEGIGRSKLTNTLLEKKLKTAVTARNWNTVLQLQKMMREVID